MVVRLGGEQGRAIAFDATVMPNVFRHPVLRLNA
jgi:hypothetical protein